MVGPLGLWSRFSVGRHHNFLLRVLSMALKCIANHRICQLLVISPCRKRSSPYLLCNLEVQKVSGQWQKPPKILIIIVSADDFSLLWSLWLPHKNTLISQEMGITQTLKSNKRQQRLHHRLMHVNSLGYITILLIAASHKQQFYLIAPQSIDVHQMTQQMRVALTTLGKTTYSL